MNISALISEVEGLSVSVVVYRPDPAQLAQTLDSLALACDALRVANPGVPIGVHIVNNGGLPDDTPLLDELRAHQLTCTVIAGHGNVGYGRGHNLAIDRTASRYHLVLNPDIDLERDSLVQAMAFLDEHPEVGLLTPRIGDHEGSIQYLCRRYPTVLDLFIRGFLPGSVRRFFSRRLARYEMRDLVNERDIVWDPLIVSGCFMLFRTSVLKKLAGFDPRYFLYFEDYDLSLRTHDVARVAYLPAVRVQHHGGGAARKGSSHIRMFAASAVKFFNRFGWKLL
ncbi:MULTISPECIES: glycosyltransferase family 2 protein [Paraburkholderia]|uniref:glycosyltransferase family 2 protein n=1 Tax=Paraburkholderia TaxID=1822464 RepID=UPI00224F59F2|nr:MULTISPECIES: glycosyltransferase family 2 protein [Paraburkholderia]MCX4159950.1 glycosyltransferase family 2 protein [Paraburkholderia megapolitana]MDN7155450.1 glycosyltransferase family 2 protein [Paraburkholderia sp. CHISQ3]MDQ6492494.1 glycosyltransferase family 2 protein [Paraburkholderia megapolitana]